MAIWVCLRGGARGWGCTANFFGIQAGAPWPGAGCDGPSNHSSWSGLTRRARSTCCGSSSYGPTGSRSRRCDGCSGCPRRPSVRMLKEPATTRLPSERRRDGPRWTMSPVFRLTPRGQVLRAHGTRGETICRPRRKPTSPRLAPSPGDKAAAETKSTRKRRDDRIARENARRFEQVSHQHLAALRKAFRRPSTTSSRRAVGARGPSYRSVFANLRADGQMRYGPERFHTPHTQPSAAEQTTVRRDAVACAVLAGPCPRAATSSCANRIHVETAQRAGALAWIGGPFTFSRRVLLDELLLAA